MGAFESLTPEMEELRNEIVSNGIDADEVLRLRKEVFADGLVSIEEANLLFYLNANSQAGNSEEWPEFFVEALTDFFVWKQDPVGYLSQESADFLVNEITRDGKIDNKTEFALLSNVIGHLRIAPESVATLALEGIRETVLGGGFILFGPDRQLPNVITQADVEVIRSVIFSGGSDGGLMISRREAELIFELNDKTVEKENASEWQTLFVQAIAHYLMFPTGTPEVPDREEAQRREQWLQERRGTGDLLKRVFGSFTSGKAIDALASEIKGSKADKGAADRIAAAEAYARESIVESEATWLIGQIMQDGVLHENEKALLNFIKDNSPNIHASLDSLIEKAAKAA